jgi:hypothetical protein
MAYVYILKKQNRNRTQIGVYLLLRISSIFNIRLSSGTRLSCFFLFFYYLFYFQLTLIIFFILIKRQK